MSSTKARKHIIVFRKCMVFLVRNEAIVNDFWGSDFWVRGAK